LAVLHDPQSESRAGFDPRTLGCKCDECPLKGRTPVPPESNPQAKMILLGESPGNIEAYEGRPFCGPTGKYVDSQLVSLGIPRKELHVTNTILCMPKRDDFDEMVKAQKCCAPRLRKEISEASNAKVIFSCGALSLHATMNARVQDRFVGTPQASPVFLGKTVVQSWHPTFVAFHQPTLKPLFRTFLKRAWDFAIGELTPWVWPALHTDLNVRSVDALRRILESPLPVGFDVETIPSQDTITCIGLSNGVDTVSLPWDSYTTKKWGSVVGLRESGELGREAERLILSVLATKNVVTQNGAFDVHEFAKRGIHFKNGWDTMIAHGACWPQLRHGLEFIAVQYFHMPRWKSEFKAYSDEKGSEMWANADPIKLRTYNACDALMTILLKPKLEEDLLRLFNGEWIYSNLMRDAELAAKASEIGILTSITRLGEHRENLAKLSEAPRQELITLGNSFQLGNFQWDPEAYFRILNKMGVSYLFTPPLNQWFYNETRDASKLATKKAAKNNGDFNPASNKQLKTLFFKKLGCRVTSYTDSGDASLNDQALSKILSGGDSEIAKSAARALLKVRMFDKLRSTYVDGLEDQLDSIEYVENEKGEKVPTRGVFHPSFMVHAAQTGRWSSYIHTIPKPRKENGVVVAPGLRDVFLAREGYHIVEADFSQLELRGIALLASDVPLIEAYKAGADIHDLNAFDLFGSKEKQFRDLAKNFVYGVGYGSADYQKSAKSLWGVLRVDFPKLQLWTVLKLVRQWYKKHPAIADWRAAQLAFAKVSDYIREPFSGRTRVFYGKVKETEVYNYPIQTLGAYLMTLALRDLESHLDWDTHRFLIQWHDALYLESREPEAAAQILKSVMERTLEYAGYEMTFTVDVSIGKDLANKTKWKP
jgi:uracil-DNA glycosylase family 4